MRPNVSVQVVIPLPMEAALLSQILAKVTEMDPRAAITSAANNEVVVSFTALRAAEAVYADDRPTIRIDSGLDDDEDPGIGSPPQ